MTNPLEEVIVARHSFVRARVAWNRAVVKAYEAGHSPRKIATAVSAPGSKVVETQIRRILTKAGLIAPQEGTVK